MAYNIRMHEIPANIIHRDIQRVLYGGSETILSVPVLLNLTGLDKEHADGKSILQRISGTSNLGSIFRYRAVKRCENSLSELSQRINRFTASPNEEILAQNLITLGLAQMIREGGSLCFFSKLLLEEASLNRPDLFNSAVERALQKDMPQYFKRLKPVVM